MSDLCYLHEELHETNTDSLGGKLSGCSAYSQNVRTIGACIPMCIKLIDCRTVSTSANITEQKNMIRSILILQKQHQHQRQRPQQIAMMVDTERSFENLSIDSASPGNNTDNHESESDDRPRSLSPGANVNSSYLSATVQEMPDSTQISDPNSPAALKDDHVPELEWYSLKPKLDVFKDMIQITWHHRRLPAPTDQPNEVKSQEKHDLTLPNSITLKSLPEFERGLVCGSLDLIKSSSRWKTLTSLTVEEQDLQKGDVTFKNVPSFQLVVRLRSHKPRRAPRFLDTATQRRRQDWSVSLRPAQDQTHSIDIDEFGFATPMTSKKDRTKHSTIDYRDSGIRTPADIMRNRRDREARRKEEYLRLDSERQDKVSSVSFSGGGYIRSEAGPLRISTAGLRYQEDLMPEKEHDIHSDSDIDTNPSIIQGGRGDYVRENLDDWTNEPVRPRFTTRISEPRPADDEDAEYSALAEVMREYTTVGSAWA